VGVAPWLAPAKGIGETPDTLARGGVMEPAARTVVSGPEWPMRAGGRGRAASGHPPGGSGRAGIRSAPTGGGGGGGGLSPRAAGGTAGGSLTGLWARPWYIYRMVGHGEGLSGSPCHQASGGVAQLGRLRWPALAHLLTSGSLVCRAPSVAKRGCLGLSLEGWGSLRLSAHGGRGNGVGLIATELSGARLVYSRLTLGRAGGAWGLMF